MRNTFNQYSILSEYFTRHVDMRYKFMTLLWQPYGEHQPVSACGITLIKAFAKLTEDKLGFNDFDLYQVYFVGQADIFSDDILHGLVLSYAESLHSMFQTGHIATFARPMTGRDPIAIPTMMWGIDDYLPRIMTGTFNRDRWTEPDVPPSHRIFVDDHMLKSWLDNALTAKELHELLCAEDGNQTRSSRTKAPVDLPLSSTGYDENQILRPSQVFAIIGLSRSTIYARAANGSFPQPVKLGERASGWFLSDIIAWQDELRRQN